MAYFISLVVSVVLVCIVAGLGSFFTAPAVDGWYASLLKPELNPPSWVFGPVWSLLYGFMAISAWRVWEKRARDARAKPALVFYIFHLALNSLWSLAFFGLQSPLLSLVVILALLLSILIISVLFYRIDRLAGMLFWPYLAWVSFATYLNLSIFILN